MISESNGTYRESFRDSYFIVLKTELQTFRECSGTFYSRSFLTKANILNPAVAEVSTSTYFPVCHTLISFTIKVLRNNGSTVLSSDDKDHKKPPAKAGGDEHNIIKVFCNFTNCW